MSEWERFSLGWLDTAIFVHPLYENDDHRERCLDILRAIEQGRATAWIDVIVVHELTYVLRRTNEKFDDRQEVVDYILGFLQLDCLHADDKDLLIDTLTRWADSQISFGDARLQALAQSRDMSVCSVNEKNFRSVKNLYSKALISSEEDDGPRKLPSS